MTLQKTLAVLALCAALCLCIGVVVDTANAQDTSATKAVDKKVAQRKTVSDSLAKGKKGEKELTGPTPVQMAIGIGSCFVMIAVVKWL